MWSRIDRDLVADRSDKSYERVTASVAIDSITQPIDRASNLMRDRVTADRSWELTDRSAKPPHALRRRFPDFLDSEFSPKLGQSLCYINRKQFGWKKTRTLERDKLKFSRRNSRRRRTSYYVEKKTQEISRRLVNLEFNLILHFLSLLLLLFWLWTWTPLFILIRC